MKDTVVLVTGSGQGIGRAIAIRLAQEGARLVIEDRLDNAMAEQTLDFVRKAGSDGCVIAGDVGSVADDRAVIEQAVEAMGRVDVLVNNAGVERRAPFLEVTEDDYDLVMDVNLKGAFFVTQAFVKHLRDTKRGGRIVNVDVTLICEQPKVKPHRLAMRERLADLLKLPLDAVSVKATTSEEMGFVGRNEGLAAQAVAAIEMPA